MFLTVIYYYYSFLYYNVWNVDSLSSLFFLKLFFLCTHPREWVWSVPSTLRVYIILLRRGVVASRSRHLKRRRRGHLKSASLCCVAATNKKVLFCFSFSSCSVLLNILKPECVWLLFRSRKSRCTVSRCYFGLTLIKFLFIRIVQVDF